MTRRGTQRSPRRAIRRIKGSGGQAVGDLNAHAAVSRGTGEPPFLAVSSLRSGAVSGMGYSSLTISPVFPGSRAAILRRRTIQMATCPNCGHNPYGFSSS